MTQYVSESQRQPSVLLVGPRIVGDDVVGGTKISFESLVDYFSASDFWTTQVVNLSRSRQTLGFFRFCTNVAVLIRSIILTAVKLPRSDVVALNISPHGLIGSGPIFWLLAKMFRKPVAIRVFGGDLDAVLSTANPLLRHLGKVTYLSSDLILLQTKQLVESFSHLKNVRFLPTGREVSSGCRIRKACRHLMFVAQLRREKGIPEIIAAAKVLGDQVTINVYGHAMPGFDPSELTAISNIRYFGEVDHASVTQAMLQNDVLLFPSYYDGEGYPGAVIEALQTGMPVIATRWKSLPEIITDRDNGMLIEPKSADALCSAIQELIDDPDLVTRLSTSAAARGRDFSSLGINKEYDQQLRRVAGLGAPLCAE